MKRETARGERKRKTPPTKVLTARIESEFAERLEEKAKKRGVSLSRYLRHLMIADLEHNVTTQMLLTSLEKLERQNRKLHEDVYEFMRNVEVVDADD